MDIVWRRIKIKISKKLAISISSVVIIISVLSMVLNVFFANRYYIYEKRKALEDVSYQLTSGSLLSEIEDLEENQGVVISYSDITNDVEKINQEIIYGFDKKKVKLNRFWITEETIETVKSGEVVNKIYNQGISKYKVLARFMKIDNYIVAIGMPLPYMTETIDVINKFNVVTMILSIIFIVIIIFILSRRIVKPLEELKDLSKDISLLKFRKLDINTNDEIEELATSINIMSDRLEKAHNEINTQNKRLKQLLSDISHELKTPLALIKVYSQGIEDDMDDGTYLEIIKDQVDKMNSLIEKLLFWAKLDNKVLDISCFDLRERISTILKKYKLILSESDLKLITNFDSSKNYLIYADEEAIDTVLDNLITNAIKYSYDKNIEIELIKNNDNIKLIISNGINENNFSDKDDIWAPFRVMETSRNKGLSGTGLGLSMVKSILEKHDIQYGYNINKNKINFYVTFKSNSY